MKFDPRRFLSELEDRGLELWALETGEIICLGQVAPELAEIMVQHCAEIYPLLPVMNRFRGVERVH